MCEGRDGSGRPGEGWSGQFSRANVALVEVARYKPGPKCKHGPRKLGWTVSIPSGVFLLGLASERLGSRGLALGICQPNLDAGPRVGEICLW